MRIEERAKLQNKLQMVPILDFKSYSQWGLKKHNFLSLNIPEKKGITAAKAIRSRIMGKKHL